MIKSKPLLVVSIAAFILATVVVVLGAFTRLAEAGLGCPDWPLCYGHIWVPDSSEEILLANERFADTPVETDKTWPEQTHRLVASTLGLIVFVIFFMSLRHYSHKSKYSVMFLLFGLIIGTITRMKVGSSIEPLLWILVLVYFANLVRITVIDKCQTIPFKLIAFLAGLIIVQGLFGMWTVTLKLWPQVVTGHLLGGFTTATLLFLLIQRLMGFSWTFSLSQDQYKKIKGWCVVALAIVIVQISLGGWTSANYAALACADFPLCHNKFWPQSDFKQGFNIFQDIGPNYLGGVMDNHARTAIHIAHRLGAILVLVILTLFSLQLFKFKQASATRMAVVIFILLCTQITLGILNIVLSLPLSIAVMHNGVGALLMITIVTALHRVHSLKSYIKT